MTPDPAQHENNMASRLESDQDVGVVLHNLSFFFDNFETVSEVFDTDSRVQDEFLAIESEVQCFCAF